MASEKKEMKKEEYLQTLQVRLDFCFRSRDAASFLSDIQKN